MDGGVPTILPWSSQAYGHSEDRFSHVVQGARFACPGALDDGNHLGVHKGVASNTVDVLSKMSGDVAGNVGLCERLPPDVNISRPGWS